jgi:hypothetical protein
MNVDIGRAITFPTQDPNWVVKFLIGGAITFAALLVSVIISVIFGIIGGGSGLALAFSVGSDSTAASSGSSLIAYFLNIISTVITSLIFIPASGYAVQVTRNVISGQEPTLPAWDNFGQFITDGAKLWVCTFAASLPAYLLLWGGQLPSAAAPLNTSLGFVALCGTCLALPLFLLAGLVTPIIYGRYATTHDIRQTLDVGAILSTLRANLGMYFLIAIATFGIALGAILLSAFTCFLGLPFALFFIVLVSAHLAGQAHVIAQGGAMQQPAYGTPYGGGPGPYGGQRPF